MQCRRARCQRLSRLEVSEKEPHHDEADTLYNAFKHAHGTSSNENLAISPSPNKVTPQGLVILFCLGKKPFVSLCDSDLIWTSRSWRLPFTVELTAAFQNAEREVD